MDEEEYVDYWIKRENDSGVDGYTIGGNVEEEEEAWREMRERAGLTGSKERARVLSERSKKLPYFGDMSPGERALSFTNTLMTPSRRNTINNNMIEDEAPFAQNPYVDETWRTRKDLEKVNDYRTRAIFDKNYVRPRGDESIKTQSYSRPELFLLAPLHPELFKEILVTRDASLLMKITPLVKKKGMVIGDLQLQQIYNEIKTAFFLNELLYGHRHVLSIHFMVMVDWFQTSRADLGLYSQGDSTRHPLRDDHYSQFTVAEYAEDDIFEFMQNHPTMDALKGVIFQVFHALETAWITNEFIHYDMHTGNVMMKRTTGDESPLAGRNLLYKRYGYDEWFQLTDANLGGHIVKIIDFGFSRICVPTNPAHLDEEHDYRHLHDKVVGVEWRAAQIHPDWPNRSADVRLFLLSLLRLQPAVWDAIPLEEREVFYRFVDDVLDFEYINALIDKAPTTWNDPKLERDAYNGVLTPADVLYAEDCFTFLTQFGGYARNYDNKGFNVSEVLGHPFFDSLRRAPLSHSEGERGKDDLVVSFFTPTGEERMIRRLSAGVAATTTATPDILFCVVCGEEAKHYNTEGDKIVPICGGMCAEFKYLYGEKTVYR